MSRDGNHRSAITRLLGPVAARGGPLALLNVDPVDPEAIDDAAVRDALSARLREVDGHSLAQSVDAEHVRMALHAAAAQLLDPAVRELILGLNRPRGWVRPEPAPPAPPEVQPEVSPELVTEARMAIARCRGINDASLQRITAIAANAGITTQQLVAAVAARANAPAPPPSAVATNEAAFEEDSGIDGTPFPQEVDVATHTLRNAGIIAAVAIGLIAVAVGAVWQIASSMRVPRTAATESVTADIPKPAPAPQPPIFPSKPAEKSVPVVPTDAVTVVRSLTASAEVVATDPTQAAASFEAAIATLGNLWPTLSPDRLAAAQDGIVEFIYRAAQDPTIARRAAEAITAPAAGWSSAARPLDEPRVLSGVWSFGLLSRLSRERELPAAAQQVLDAAAPTSGPGLARSAGSFGVGATAAAFRLPTLLVAPGDAGKGKQMAALGAWQRWIAATDALTKDDAVLRDRILLAGLETLLIEGPDPQPGSDAQRTVALLASAVSWRPGADSRGRLISWFDHAAISAADLNALTEHLALRSAAEGIDVSMVLSRDADGLHRTEMKIRFAEAWASVDAPTRDVLAVEWHKLAQDLLSRAPSPETVAASLADAVVFSRLNDAAARIVSGDTQGAGDLLRKLEDPVKAIAISSSGQGDRSIDAGADDGSWAVRYLSAERNIPQRSALLTELQGAGGSISRVNAEVLAIDAVRGSPSSIRRQAQQAVLKYSGEPAMVNAMLELAPSLPPTNETADLVRSVAASKLPPLRDPAWRAAARRALVERLLQLLAASSDNGVVDKLSDLLSQSYIARVPTSSSSAAAPISTEAPARALALWWLRRCQSLTPSGKEPLSLDQVERRRSGRERLASGRAQSFAADQVWVFELSAFAFAAEHPDTTAAVLEIAERLAVARRTTGHIFDQIHATERAQTELWMLLLKGDVPP